MRPCRSMLYSPASKARALDQAVALPADAVIFDLEDAVAPAGKVAARDGLARALARLDYGARLRLVRVNGLDTVWGRDDVAVEREELRLAADAAACGLHGVVCSGAEAAAVRQAHGERLALLVPGIRLAGGSAHDQRRVMTPAAAQAAGARYLILGRAVTAAADPRRAMRTVLTELASAL